MTIRKPKTDKAPGAPADDNAPAPQAETAHVHEANHGPNIYRQCACGDMIERTPEPDADGES